jgi:hypothetical protein
MNSHALLALFHIFAVVPLFLYVGFARDNTATGVYPLLFGLGLIVLLYHLYKAIVKWQAGAPSAWINWIHALVVGPLLIYIGRMGRDTVRGAYEILLMVAFAAAGYHGLSLVREFNEK